MDALICGTCGFQADTLIDGVCIPCDDRAAAGLKPRWSRNHLDPADRIREHLDRVGHPGGFT